MLLSSRSFLVAFCVLCIASPVFAQRSSDSLLPSQRMLARYGLERAWFGQATLNPSRDRVRYTTIDEDNFYVQATSGVITAFDNESGRKLWALQLGRVDAASFPAVSNQELVMVVVAGTIHAIDKFTGNVIWRLRLPGVPSTAPSTDEDSVYVGMLDGSVYALNLRRVRELYQESLLPDWSYATIRWRYQTGREITTPAVSSGRIVNFASRDGSLYAVTADQRDLVYQFETDAPISAPLTRHDQTIFLASEDYTFYAINAANGRLMWDFATGLPIRKPSYVIGRDLFITPERGGLYAVDVETGDQIWWRPELTKFLAATSNLLFASDREFNVVLVSREDGGVLAALPMYRFQVRLSNDRTDRLYLTNESGTVVCIRQRGRTLPVYHKYPERLPILPEFAPEEAPPEPEEAGAANAAN